MLQGKARTGGQVQRSTAAAKVRVRVPAVTLALKPTQTSMGTWSNHRDDEGA